MLGIEAVEWFSEGGETLTVRVTGRWRRRRPAWSGQPMLVLEAQGRRHRFPAMPEPPSLTGAGPGTWRISFSVPVALAPDLGGRTWLQFGSVVVALPAAVQPLAAGEGEIDVAGADPSSQLDAVDEGVHPASSELETESARRRAKGAEAVAAELAKRVHTLESALAAARRQADELSTALTERELGRRAAEQRAHAEQALRRDLTRKLSARSEEGARARQALGDLAAAEQRIRELEAELADARRRGDEAEQFAAAAAVARERAEHHATDAEHRATDAEHRAGHAEHRATDAEHRATDAEHRVTDAEHHAADAEHRATDAQNSAARAERERTAPSAVSGPGSAELVRLRFERGLIGRRVNAEPRVPSEPWPPVAHATLEHEVGAEARPSSAATPSSSSAEVPMPVPPSYVAAAEPITDSSRALIATLRRELDVRAGAEATLLARIVEAESKLGTRVLLERRTAAILVELRRELDGLRAAWEAERAGRAAAEERADELAGEAAAGRRRSRQAHEAIVELRRALRELQAAAADESSPPAPEDPPPSVAEEQPPAPAPDQPYPAPDPPHPAPDPPSRSAPDQPPSAAAEAPAPAAADEPAPAQVVEPERFNVARVRLREAIAPHEPGPEPAPAAAPSEGTTVTPWLEPIFRGVARTDPDAAGRMLLALLPAQRVAFAEPVAYDLVLGGHRGCARVTVRDGAPVIRYADGPRPGGEVDFQVLGDPAAVARLLTAGPLRRLMRRGVARVRGRRDRLGALRGLVGVRLDFPGLYRAGVRLEPELALMIVARMIEPAWTARERFTVAYAAEAGTVYLLVRDGRPVQVTDEPPGGRIATTITGPAEALALVLSGERGEPVTVTGEDWPLALLRKWIKRAQSD